MRRPLHRPNIRVAAVLLALLAVTGFRCRPTIEEPMAESALPLARFRAQTVSYMEYSGIDDSVRVVVRDSASWRAYWQRIHHRATPAPPLPTVDFGREMVVLAALGARRTGGYAIVVDSVFASAKRVDIFVRRSVPGAGCLVTAAITQPVDLARVPARAMPVQFHEREVMEDCQ